MKKSRILEIWNRAIFGFQGKNYLVGLKSVHFQEYVFRESGEVDRFLKMGTHMQERSSSLVLICKRDRALLENQTAPRPSEHPPVMGEKMSKRS